MEGAGHELAGSGRYGSITIALATPNDAVTVVGDTLRLDGVLTFEQGNLDLNSRIFAFAPNATRRHIVRNLNERPGGTGDVVGGTFLAGSPNTINPDGMRYDLTYTGDLTNLFVPGLELHPSYMQNFTIAARDPVNTPAVFGVVLPEGVEVGGDFTLASGGLLRLLNAPMALVGEGAAHTVGGRIIGAAVRMEAGGQVDGLGTGYIERLTVAAPNEAQVTVEQLAALTHLAVISGATTLALGTNELGVLGEIEETLQLDGGVLALASNVMIGPRVAGALTLTNGELDLRAHTLFLGDEAVFEAQATATISTTPLPVTSDLDTTTLLTDPAGFVVFLGEGVIEAATAVPRLKLAAQPTSGSDNVFLSNDTRIGEALVIENGDLFVGSANLIVEGGVWAIDTDGVAFDESSDAIFGDFGSEAGEVTIVGSLNLLLGAPLDLISTGLHIDAASTDTIRFAPLATDVYDVTLLNKRLRLDGGHLALGLHDLVLRGNASGLLSYTAGSVSAHSLPIVPANWPLNTAQHYPLDESAFGELIVSGSGNASMIMLADLTVPNFTVAGAVRFPDSTGVLQVDRRFAFGQGDASMVTDRAGQLVFGDGVQVVRRGRGTLIHRPQFVGRTDVFYDLDDGDLTGNPTGFGPGTLQTGPELPSVLGVLMLMPGEDGRLANTLRLSQPVRVSEALIHVSGAFDLNGHTITLAEDAAFHYLAIDPDARPLVPDEQLSLFSAEGAVGVNYVSQFEPLILNRAFLPLGVPIASLTLALGEPESNRVVNAFMQNSRTVGRLHMANATAASALQLNGNDLTVVDDVFIERGVLRSNGAAQMFVGGALAVGALAELRGSIALNVTGNTDNAGVLAPASLSFAGDLLGLGTLDRSTSLEATGANQTMRLSGEGQTLGNFALRQQAAAGTFPRFVLVSADGTPQALHIEGMLTLEGGVVQTGNNALVLAASGPGFMRPEGVVSHIEGNLRRGVQAGRAGEVAFPVGTGDVYRPLILRFEETLLTEATFSVEHQDEVPLGAVGLPAEVAGEEVAAPLNFFWRVTSTIDFARSLPYTLQVELPEDEAGVLDDLRFLVRSGSDVTGSWAGKNGIYIYNVTNRRALVSLSGVRGDLLPEGTTLALGRVGGPSASLATVQFLNNFPRTMPLALSLGQEQALGMVPYRNATALLPFIASEGDDGFLVSGRTEETFVSFGTVAPVPSTQSLAVLHADAEGGGQLQWVGDMRAVATQSDAVDVRLINGYSRGAVRAEWVGSNAEVHMVQPFNAAPWETLPAVELELRLFEEGESQPSAVYTFDARGLAGEAITVLASGYPRDLADSDATSNLAVVMLQTDGNVQPIDFVVAREEDTVVSTVPTAFTLGAPYPNPVSEAASLPMDLPMAASVRVEVYDLLGRIVQRQGPHMRAAGAHRVVLRTEALATGAYFVRVFAQAYGQQWHAVQQVVVVR